MATKDDQLNFIAEIESSKTNFLVIDYKNDKHQYSPEDRFPILSNYINKNFTLYKKINEFNVLKKIK